MTTNIWNDPADGARFSVVPFAEAHVPEAARIERACFSDPWSEDALRYYLTSAHAAAVAVVDGTDGSLAAYGGLEYVLDEGNITNVATRPDLRRRGCARAVLKALSDFARQRGVCTLWLEVRVSNEGARALYRSCGFADAGLRRGYYAHPKEDAVLMRRDLAGE